jgi:hypothetical protein
VEGDQENKTGQETFSTSRHHKEFGQEAHAFAEHLAEVFQPHPTEK